VQRLVHRLLRADGLDDGVGAESVGEVLDRGHTLVAACLDNVAGAELARQALAALVTAHGDDALGAVLFGRQDRE
jgi:hypothetical protein